MSVSNRAVVGIAAASALFGAAITAGALSWQSAAASAESEPAQSEPAQSEPAQSEPAQSEPAQSEPAQSEPAQAERAHDVHEMGATVMPFALEKTTHVFEMTDSGGIQDVVAKESGDTATIRLIRQHLRHEAELFRRGDFRDPVSLHGSDMPGVQELAAGSDRLRVEYQELPDGARITYSTDDPALRTAVHRWFGAQLSDHGADATYR